MQRSRDAEHLAAGEAGERDASARFSFAGVLSIRWARRVDGARTTKLKACSELFVLWHALRSTRVVHVAGF